MNTKENCWEYYKCGREPGGVKSRELGVCPAAKSEAADGINHGKAAGRFCWTILDSKSPEARADKFCNCMNCPFFNKVIAEEGRGFNLGVSRSPSLLVTGQPACAGML